MSGQIIGVLDRFREWQAKHQLSPDGDLGPAGMGEIEDMDVRLAAAENEAGRLMRENARLKRDLDKERAKKKGGNNPAALVWVAIVTGIIGIIIGFGIVATRF